MNYPSAQQAKPVFTDSGYAIVRQVDNLGSNNSSFYNSFVLREQGLLTNSKVNFLPLGDKVANKDSDDFAKYFNKLKALSELKDNWDGDEAPAPNKIAINKANEVLDVLYKENLAPTRVKASVEGGVSIYFLKDKKYADIECFNNGEILGAISDRIKPEVWQIYSEFDMDVAVIKISEFLNGKYSQSATCK